MSPVRPTLRALREDLDVPVSPLTRRLEDASAPELSVALDLLVP
ncbi:hypothetical protein [Streptomyces montanisoli]|nr:hypothetical protein [Streptomyces montanisoli]